MQIRCVKAITDTCIVTARKHLRAKVTPVLHLQYSKNWGKPGVGSDKSNIRLVLNSSIDC